MTTSLELESPASTITCTSPVLELRQYTLHPGQRDTLIGLFEREFIEPQEAAGMELVGQFRDLDAPDRFVWLRGFRDMGARKAALATFYGGEVWKAHRGAANTTMIDSDDVLLLRPTRPAAGFVLAPRTEAPRDDDPGVVLATIHHLRQRDAAGFVAYFERVWVPLLWNASVAPVASLISEHAPNTFPALPVRDGESVFVWFSRHASLTRAMQAQARIEQALDWSPAIGDELAAHLSRPSELLRLAPTARSRLRG